jgi:AcrR family transcriptional regulator
MPTQPRRERAREERRDLIVRTARALAETEGWESVTTRRLAEAVDYSQPVLYGHFKNMDAIVAAVALEGFTELATALRAARLSGQSSGEASGPAAADAAGLRAVADAYLGYAEEHPAVYEAMFVRRTDLVFGGAESPEALKAAFGEILAGVTPFAGGDAETLTEVFWSALHGQATLNHGARLRPTHRHARATLLTTLLTST